MTRRSTSTSAFGVSKRESHDASAFYQRFTPPIVSSDSAVALHRSVDKLITGDARHMDEVSDSSVALVVTSPPYFAGKEYEESLGDNGDPATYLEYLDLLRDVFAECVRKLEPGGRIAVNVANLGRRPYRSLSADVTGILQDDLRLLLRGEIIWLKQRGSSGSCAWGSFQTAANPVLRDLTERVIVASKGRFDRALPAMTRLGRELPSESSMTRDDFMENTLDVWEIPAESATRVGHPAPFPIELPGRLIDLYTYRGDLVLDPFAGSGTTAVAAIRAGRHYAGYDLDGLYIELAETRVEQERQRLACEGSSLFAPHRRRRAAVPAEADVTSGAAGVTPSAAGVTPAAAHEDWLRAIQEGRATKEIARTLIQAAGFGEIREKQRQPGGVVVSFTAVDLGGRRWCFEIAGSLTSYRAGMRKPDILWKALGKAAVLHEVGDAPVVLLTPDVPAAGNAGAETLRWVTGPSKPIRAVIAMTDQSGLDHLRILCTGEGPG